MKQFCTEKKSDLAQLQLVTELNYLLYLQEGSRILTLKPAVLLPVWGSHLIFCRIVPTINP